VVAVSLAQNIVRRPIVRQSVSSGNGSGQWSESPSPENVQQHIATTSHPTTTSTTSSSFVQSNKTYASIVKPTSSAAIVGQCIPGTTSHVSVKPALSPSKNFFPKILFNF
jgi:hypothetical protein